MISELIRLQSRAKALENRLLELEKLYQSGDEDVGRVIRLKTSLEEERIQILSKTKELFENKIPHLLAEALERSEKQDDNQKVKESLEHLAKQRGWGTKFIGKIKKHKGDIIDLVISIAIKVAKEMAVNI